MAKEYSIYFENRRVLLSENIDPNCFINENGLFVSYRSLQELSKILEFFQTSKEVENVFIKGKDADELLNDFSKSFKAIFCAGGLVRNTKGEYLLIYRRNKWDLPKGKQDSGEKIEATAIREVSEETGITNMQINNHLIDTYHTYKADNNVILKKTVWYEMTYNGDEPLIPQQNEDIEEAKWVKKDQLAFCLGNTYSTILDVFKAAGVI